MTDRNKSSSILLIMILMLTPILGGCAGMRARNTALRPVLLTIWPRVEPDIQLGVKDAEVQIGSTAAAELRQLSILLREELERGDRDRDLPAMWAQLEPHAVRGVQLRIQRGELAEENSRPVFQRILNFRDSLDELAGAPPRMGGVTRQTYRWRDSNGTLMETTRLVGEPRHEDPLARLGVKL